MIPDRVAKFLDEARTLEKSVDCFDFVPSDYETVWSVLSSVRMRFPTKPAPSFCEWGSGLGVVAGMAVILGFDASGIELDAALADQSRKLLRRHGLAATVTTGSYLEMVHTADVIFVYCWPGRMLETQQHFVGSASSDALLLICSGAADVRCLTREQLLGDWTPTIP